MKNIQKDLKNNQVVEFCCQLRWCNLFLLVITSNTLDKTQKAFS